MAEEMTQQLRAPAASQRTHNVAAHNRVWIHPYLSNHQPCMWCTYIYKDISKIIRQRCLAEVKSWVSVTRSQEAQEREQWGKLAKENQVQVEERRNPLIVVLGKTRKQSGLCGTPAESYLTENQEPSTTVAAPGVQSFLVNWMLCMCGVGAEP